MTFAFPKTRQRNMAFNLADPAALQKLAYFYQIIDSDLLIRTLVDNSILKVWFM